MPNSLCALLTYAFLWLFLLTSAAPAAAEITHKVKQGETLFAISRKYHVPVERIKEANDLADEHLRVGRRLKVPASSPAGSVKKRGGEAGGGEIPESHIVKKGETLAKIARHYRVKIGDLQEINGLQGKKVKTGQTLQLRRPAEEDEDIEGDARQDGKEDDPGGETAVSVVQGAGFLAEEKNRELLARVALGFRGARYTRGGSTINGMDCSSFVQRVYRIFAIDLPRTAREQFRIGYEVSRDSLRIGDLLFFARGKARHPTHVAIYIGDDQFIHTSLKKRRVDIDTVSSRYFNLRFLGAKRIEEAKPLLEAGKPAAGEAIGN